MKYQSLFSGKNISLSSAELAQRVVKVNWMGSIDQDYRMVSNS